MKNKTLLTIALSTLLASSLYAYNGGCGNKSMKNGCNYEKSCKGNKKGMMGKKGHFKKGNKIFYMFSKLDLSQEQRTKIQEIMKNSRQNMQKPHDAFSSTSFDKEKFIKIHEQKRENKIKQKADMIEKAYKVLNADQKKEFRAMLDKKEKMKKERMNNYGKNCYGRG